MRNLLKATVNRRGSKNFGKDKSFELAVGDRVTSAYYKNEENCIRTITWLDYEGLRLDHW